MTKLSTIIRLANVVDRALNRMDASTTYGRAVGAIIRLANVVKEYEGDGEDIWHHEPVDISGLLAGSYWFFDQNHSGQWSKEYAALSAIRSVYSPGPYETGPESESGELDVYSAWVDLARTEGGLECAT